MGSNHIRISTKGEDAAVRMADKTSPFSDEMKRNSAVRFESRKFTQNDIHANYQAASKRANLGKVKAPNGGKANQVTGLAANAKTAATTLNAIKSVGQTANSTLNEFSEEVREERKDNLGLRTVDESVGGLIRTKKAITGTIRTAKKTAKVAKKTANATIKVTKKVGQAAKKVGELAVKAAQKVAAAVTRLVTFLIAHPIVLAVVLVVLILIVLIFMLISAFQATPKNIMGEEMYTAIQAYLQERDRAVQLGFENYENSPWFSDIAEEDVTKVAEIYPATSMKLMSSYLVAKYENALTLEVAKQEIDAIHSQLYRIEHEITTEEYEADEPVLNEWGQPVMNADGTPMTKTVTKIKRLLTVTLTGQTLQQFFDDYLDFMLTKSQKGYYDWFIFISDESDEFGSGEFIPPFEDGNHMAHVTQEFGVPGVLDGKPHRGIDFAYPVGTPILNIMGGTVVEVSDHYSWGLTVVVESEDGTYRVRYAHMSAIHVAVGGSLAAGDVVGLVGNTGTSTGAHLHLEVEENGQLINPRDVLPG